MSNEDRRSKLAAKRQKEVVAPGYCAPKTKGGKDKREAWVNALKDGTYVFYVRYGYSELELGSTLLLGYRQRFGKCQFKRCGLPPRPLAYVHK